MERISISNPKLADLAGRGLLGNDRREGSSLQSPRTGIMATAQTSKNTYKVLAKHYCSYDVELSGELAKKDGEPRKVYVHLFPMPSVTVDLVSFDETLSNVRLVKRGPNTEPVEFVGMWVVPGGFLGLETAAEGACREYKEETGETLDPKDLLSVCTATEPNRDPRQRTVSIVFTAIAPKDSDEVDPLDTEEITGKRWVPVADILTGSVKLGFDHNDLVRQAYYVQVKARTLSY